MDDFCLHETTKAQLWPVLKELVASGKRYRVSIKEWHDKRSVSQNALLWKWNGEIAGQLVGDADELKHQPGLIIFSGRTRASNSSLVTYPPPTASSRRVVPFLWAVLAILAALS